MDPDVHKRLLELQPPMAERRRGLADNPRGKWERGSDAPMTMQQMAVQVLAKHGPIALIAGFLIYFLVGNLQGTTQRTLDELRDHAYATQWYQHQTCISIAVLAGTAKELCEPPRERR